MKQKTAVDWLFDKIKSHFEHDGDLFETLTYTIAIAKQKENEQHKETFKQSRQAKIFEKDMPPVWDSFEQYYNETYGGNQ
jgi:hypothetical protein